MQNLFSYPVELEDFSVAAKTYRVKANAAELAHIAGILKVEGAKTVEASIVLKMRHGENLLDVHGKIKAALELKSVISLENFERRYDISFEMVVDTKMTLAEQEHLAAEEGFEGEVPDVLVDGKIDLGDIVIEQIALNLEDYPRKEGEIFEFVCEEDSDSTDSAAAENPFAALKNFKCRKKK